MRIALHIGPDAQSSQRLQQVLDQKRAQLARQGVLYARSPNAVTHTRLFMAVSDPGRPCALRVTRGFATAEAQRGLYRDLERSLLMELDKHRPDLLILSAHHLGAGLTQRAELDRLKALLTPYSDDIRVIAHVEAPVRMFLRRYGEQVLEGRVRSPGLELSLLGAPSWWEAALDTAPAHAPSRGVLADAQSAVHWLDFQRLVTEWDAVFGAGATQLRAYDPAIWADPEAVCDEIRAAFGFDLRFGKAPGWAVPPVPPAPWITRCRLFNDAALRLTRVEGRAVPHVMWRRLLVELGVDGPAMDPGALSRLSARFARQTGALLAAHPGLTRAALEAPVEGPDWTEHPPLFGFRATQYLTAFLPRIERAWADADKAAGATAPDAGSISPGALSVMTPLARQKLAFLQTSPFRPHNRLGAVNEEELAPAFAPAPPRAQQQGSTGTVIVACMKTEAPYILEWLAHHRAIGVDNFVVYTNGSDDTTDPLLQRLDALGLVHHRSNDGWTGKSPQQHALDLAVSDPVVQAADWVAHIDVDEFINVRCGNGTLADFQARVPGATHVAMTWRLFGHNGIAGFDDRLVIDQFDTCAPRFVPKPHTAWGFKTLQRNTGAYRKLSCHRPNGLVPEMADQVKWVNGSGQDMTTEVLRNGWRNSKKSIGYDLLQLNHYALRSAESFLIKRQRGRALHVDRTIGLNYWIRMDWSGARDITIKRNIPRLRAELSRMMQDPEVARLHAEGVAWHRARAAELRATPEFAQLFDSALTLEMTPTERAAVALALDVES